MMLGSALYCPISHSTQGDSHQSDSHQRFQELCQLVASSSQETEAARRLSEGLARKLADEGLFAMFVPRQIGGGELNPLEAAWHLHQLAQHDAASAWVAMVGTTTGLGASYIDPSIGADLFGAAGRITCGIFAPSGQAIADGDGYLLTGRWSWASGSANADYIGVGCTVAESTTLDAVRLMMVPRSEFIFHDNWHSLGLCGTSSGDIELQRVRVPADHSYSIFADKPWAEGALYTMPYFGLLAVCVAAVALGNARAALDYFHGLAQTKTAQGHKGVLSGNKRVQGALAESEARWRSVDALFWQQLDQAWQRALQGQPMDPVAQAELRLGATFAVRTCVDVVRQVHDLAGGSSVYRSSPIQKHLRDAETMTQHMITNAATYAMVGQVMLGGNHQGLPL